MASTIYAVPGRLIIAGDVADAVYERCTDMVYWAKGSIRDPYYVTEKVPHAFDQREHSEEAAQERLQDILRDWADRMDEEDDICCGDRKKEGVALQQRLEMLDKFRDWKTAVSDGHEWERACYEMHDAGLADWEQFSATDVSQNLCWAYWVLRTWLEKADPAELEPQKGDVR